MEILHLLNGVFNDAKGTTNTITNPFTDAVLWPEVITVFTNKTIHTNIHFIKTSLLYL